MAVTNMSIIEKDDLIKKMPRDALKEELRNPSGNFPLFLVAARLKEVEEMERDMMARQAAQQSSQEGESVAARLAQQAMPESPMSGVGANPAPQPRPDPQGIMAQQMAGPTQPLPTVMAQSGLRGKYPGQASGIDQEILAAAVRSRQAKGAPRLYNRERKAGFERAGRKGAAPASQIPALLGLASALAKTEERAYGGMETLPPFQVESSTMPMSAKGFAARARSVGSRMPEEEDGLSYISKLLKSMGGSSDDKPTVFAQEGFGYDPALEKIFTGQGEDRRFNPEGFRDVYMGNVPPDARRTAVRTGLIAGSDVGEGTFFPGRVGMESIFPEDIKARNEAIGQVSDLYGNRRQKAGREPVENPKSFGETLRDILGTTPNRQSNALNRARQGKFAVQRPTQTQAASANTKPDPAKTEAPPQPAVKSSEPPSGPVKKAPDQITDIGGVPAVDFVGPAEGGDKPPAAAGSPYDVSAILKSLQAGAEPEEVGSVNEYLTQAEKLIPDLSPERRQVIKDYEEQLASVQKRDPVPKSLTDIRDRMQKRLDDLENSPLPFMTAAAAAIKGNQPILVAMTNAMIGYTAGDEKVKNQGLKIMGDIVDTDVKIEGLKSKQMELETTARNALMKARQEDIEGRDKRARELLTLANNNRNAAQRLSVENAKLEQQRLGQISNFVGATLKTVEEKDRYNTLVGALMEDEGMSRSDAMIRAYTAIRGGTTSTAAETLRLRYDSEAQKWMEKNYRNLRIRYNRSEAGKNAPSVSGKAGYDPKVIAWAESEGALPPNQGVKSAIGRIFTQNKGTGGGKAPAPPKGFTVNTK